jgi:hypothetical protein
MTPVKHHQRLDHGRLAEVLHERGVASVDTIRDLLQQSREGGMPFCEALVTTNLVPDWDLSRIVCETFSLPFLPIDMVEPNAKLRTELDLKLFRQHQVIPLDRFGQVLTVIMPGLVQADVLAQLSAASDFVILPVVGTVETNRRWILENFGNNKNADIEGGWSSLFDQADAAVTASLGAFGEVQEGPPGAGEYGFAPPRPVGISLDGDGARVDELQFDLGATAAPVRDEDALDLGVLDALGDDPALGRGTHTTDNLEDGPFEVVDLDAADRAPQNTRSKGPKPTGTFDLPPMPDFGSSRQAS